MNNSFVGTTLHVQDLERSMEFYSKIPGAVLERHRPGQIAIYRIGNGRIGLLQWGESGFHIEVECADVDSMYQLLLSDGVTVLRPLGKRPWGDRDFMVRDPDGYLVEFGGMG